MRWIFLAAAVLSVPAQAALIEYTYEMQTYKLLSGVVDSSEATATLLVDTSEETIKHLSYTSPFADFLWTGEISPGVYYPPQGVSQHAFSVWASFQVPGFQLVDIYLEHNQGTFEGSVLNYLHTVNTESVFDFQFEGDEHHYGSVIRSANKRVVSVPEPATLSLLALGLAAIGIRRRLKLLG